MSNDRYPPRRRITHDEETEAVLAACRVLVAISARSIAAVEDVAGPDPGSRVGGDSQPRVGVVE